MEKLIEILSEIRPDINFKEENELIDGGLLDSFDMVTIISEVSDNYGVDIEGKDLTPENFNSAESILRLIKKHQG